MAGAGGGRRLSGAAKFLRGRHLLSDWRFKRRRAAADGGLLAAYGHALYLAEYEPGEAVANTFAPAWNYTLLLYDFNRNACEPIVLGGGHTISLPQGNRDFPQRFGAASGVVKPDGEEMLWFCWEYVTQYRHFPDSLPLASR